MPIRYAAERDKAGVIRQLTTLTVDEFEWLVPLKKPKGGELTAEQKAANQAIAKRRILIEHVISGIKRCRIVKDTIRIWKDGVRDLVMEICCALHNLRTRSRPQPLATSKKSV